MINICKVIGCKIRVWHRDNKESDWKEENPIVINKITATKKGVIITGENSNPKLSLETYVVKNFFSYQHIMSNKEVWMIKLEKPTRCKKKNSQKD